jgi:hypothetical protein
MDMLSVSKQIFALPSSMITAAISAFLVMSQAFSIRVSVTESHLSFANVNGLLTSMSIV